LGEQAQESFFGTSGCHIKVINNGIDTATFTPTPCDDLNENYDINGRKVLLGVAMPWSKQKGFNDFIALRGMLPMEEYAIVLVGVSPEQKQSLPEGIIGIESTHNAEELAKWYSRADALLALSKAETFGLTVVEALSCGTPAIVYNTTALPKLTTPETGIAVELGNIEQLKCAVEEVTSRGKEFYGEACRKRAVEMFDQKSCYDKYISLYHDLLK
jgi:glycosyltransferase involved in cell wall biosynthesis